MNILIISEGVFPEVYGGSQTSFYEISRRLAARGHRVTHLTLSQDRALPHQEKLEGVSMVRFWAEAKGRLDGIFKLPAALLSAFRPLIRRETFDVILLHHSMSAFWICLGFAHLPLVYYFHSPWHLEFKVRKFYEDKKATLKTLGTAGLIREVEKFFLSRVRRIIVESDFMRSHLEAMLSRGAKPRIRKFFPGIDLVRFAPPADRDSLRKSLGIAPEAEILLTVRRFVARMGIDQLIEAMREVRAARPKAELWIGGKGAMENLLKKKARELHLQERVKFLGALDPAELVRVYQAADLFILPTQELEGFGLVTLEAMACGTPVLGTRIGGTREILEGFDPDFLVDAARSEFLAAGIKKWLSKNQELAKARARARVFVETHYNWETRIKVLESLLEEVKDLRKPVQELVKC